MDRGCPIIETRHRPTGNGGKSLHAQICTVAELSSTLCSYRISGATRRMRIAWEGKKKVISCAADPTKRDSMSVVEGDAWSNSMNARQFTGRISKFIKRHRPKEKMKRSSKSLFALLNDVGRRFQSRRSDDWTALDTAIDIATSLSNLMNSAALINDVSSFIGPLFIVLLFSATLYTCHVYLTYSTLPLRTFDTSFFI